MATSPIPWVEKYRPSHFQDIVLDPLNREMFQNILHKNYFPNLLFYGPPGTGKTTTITNLINEYQSRYNRINKSNVIHLNASDERGIDIIRNQIHQFARSMNLFESGFKFVILDEVDYMTKNAQQALKSILQTSTYNVRFCLICNYITKMDESLKNEFLCIRFNQSPRRDIFDFIKMICVKEDVHITDTTIETIQDMYHSDIRSMINFLQGFAGKTDTSALYTPFHVSVLAEIHAYLHQESDGDATAFITYIHDLSVRYNLDKKTILQKYFNYLIRSDLDVALDDIEIVMHQPDLPMEVVLEYVWSVFRERKIRGKLIDTGKI